MKCFVLFSHFIYSLFKTYSPQILSLFALFLLVFQIVVSVVVTEKQRKNL